jgi:hypothetical protein
MVKGIQTTQIYLSNAAKQLKHRGEMFPGATIAYMHSNFKPVLHVETNDAANRKARGVTKDVTICVRK